MIRALAVLTVGLNGFLLVCGMPAVPDPSDPEGLDPVETLYNPTRHTYKTLKGSGYEAPRVAYEEQEPNKGITDTQEKKDQSMMISKYLQFLGDVKNKRDISFEKNAIDTIRLLVAHSWLYSFDPEREYLKGTTPILLDETAPFAKIRAAIATELKNRNIGTPVADSILLYSDGILQEIRDDLESNVLAYSNMIVDEKDMKDLLDYVKEKIDIDNQRYGLLLDKNNMLLAIHNVAFKMAIQAYLRIFAANHLGEQDRFWLKSHDGKQQKEFSVPPMDADKFGQLVIEAERENEASHERPDVQTMNDEYRKQRNNIIIQYLTLLGTLKKNPDTEFEDTNSLEIVKLLLIQSWIHMLRPEPRLVSAVFPVEDYSTLDGIHEIIVLDLQKTKLYPNIVNAIIRFATVLHKQIRDQLQIQVRDLFAVIDMNINNVARFPDGVLRNNEIIRKKANIKKLTDLKLVAQFHEMTIVMCLQSYVLDFKKEPYPDPITLTSTSGKKLTMKLPPLDRNSYEDLAYFIAE